MAGEVIPYSIAFWYFVGQVGGLPRYENFTKYLERPALGDGERMTMNTQQTTSEPLPNAGSVTAVRIVADLLTNPYPHDLMAIRREVEREWGDEEVAREEMDTYCTHEAMMDARRKWTASQDAAREWLSSQNVQTVPTEGAAKKQ